MNKLIVALIGCLAIASAYLEEDTKMFSVEDYLERNAESFDEDQSENISDISNWKSFKEKYLKRYINTEEDDRRRKIFLENKRIIDQHNELFKAGKVSFEMGLNDLSDLTHEEYLNRLNGFKYDPTVVAEQNLIYNASSEWFGLPKSVDWREKGMVTEVKNQGKCGSCWAFAATGAVEGQHFRKTGRLVRLSEQNLIDCSRKYGNYGCDGGWASYAFEYIKKNNGIDTENTYPYKGIDDQCKYTIWGRGARVTGFVNIAQGDEKALTEAIATIGPIAVSIDASFPSFQHYKKGVYYEPNCSSTQSNHAVLAVGYKTLICGRDFYIIKNSWGKTWGEAGYMKMRRNKKNNCGIATTAVYPLV